METSTQEERPETIPHPQPAPEARRYYRNEIESGDSPEATGLAAVFTPLFLAGMLFGFVVMASLRSGKQDARLHRLEIATEKTQERLWNVAIVTKG